ncbi:conserved hypothetical protein [Neospora caninum Liverpool]|uniref:Origin recognition complex subunit 5 C-terminal domain-containing protein n=1 Tax=Neospora caninum (strain Liverpool) TaxID=572307 RepID=F0VID3_NEOCL|nr:conserved hypothetical protein [Neospora caninum Liverpool]CBZ53494.1 conserved hypothetical protein [Neospora caninum Liverpool]CEL67482.1 TPA: hypothetical protein BN1204_032810 [Neospora caninum Liverpool]|eukprot:XP_003883526.1 conserved hypothetical protein [Neospora caninum Liverpool]
MEDRRAASSRDRQQACAALESSSALGNGKPGVADGLRAAAARAVAASRRSKTGLVAAASHLSANAGSALLNPLKRRRVREQGGEDDFWSPSPDFQSPVTVEAHTSEMALPRRKGETAESRRPASRDSRAPAVCTAAVDGRCTYSPAEASAPENGGGEKKRKKRLSVTMHPGSPERLYYEAYDEGDREATEAHSGTATARTGTLLASAPVPGRGAAKAAGALSERLDRYQRPSSQKVESGGELEGFSSAKVKKASREATPSRRRTTSRGPGADPNEKENKALQERSPLPSLKNLYVQLSDDEESPAAGGRTLHTFPLSGHPPGKTEERGDGSEAPGKASQVPPCASARGQAPVFPSLLTHAVAGGSREDTVKNAERPPASSVSSAPSFSGEGRPLTAAEARAGESAQNTADTRSREINAATKQSEQGGADEPPEPPAVTLSVSSGLQCELTPPAGGQYGACGDPAAFAPFSASMAQEPAFTSPSLASASSFQSSFSPHALGADQLCPFSPSAPSPRAAPLSTLPLDSPWHAVPAPLRKAVAECMQAFGRERSRQLSRLVALLGDVVHPVSPIEVVGLPGTGKSHLLLSLFGASGLAWGYVDCAAACATAGAGRLAARQAICGKLLLHLALQLRRELGAALHSVHALGACARRRRESPRASEGPQEAQERSSARPQRTKSASPAGPTADLAAPVAPSPVSPRREPASASPFASAAALERLEAELQEKKSALDRLLRQMQSGGKRSADTLAFSGTLFSAGFSANSVEQFVSLLRQLLRCSSPLARPFSVPLVIDEAFCLAQNMPDLLHALLRLPELLGGESSLGGARSEGWGASPESPPCEAASPESETDPFAPEKTLEGKELVLPPRNVCVVLVGRSPLRPEIFEGLPQPPRVHFRAYEANESRDILVRSFRSLGLPVLRLTATQQAARRPKTDCETRQCTDTELSARKKIEQWVYGLLEPVEQRTVVGVAGREGEDGETSRAAERDAEAREQAKEAREGLREDGYAWESRLVLRRMRRRLRDPHAPEQLDPSTAIHAAETAGAGNGGEAPKDQTEKLRSATPMRRSCVEPSPGTELEEGSGEYEKTPYATRGGKDHARLSSRSEAAVAQTCEAAACGVTVSSPGENGEGRGAARAPEEVDLLLDVEVLWSHFVTLFIQAFHQSLKSDFHEQRFLCREFWGQAMNLLLQDPSDAGISALAAAATQAAATQAAATASSPFSFASVRAASVAAASFLARLLHPHFRAALRHPFSHFLPDLQNRQILDAKRTTVWGASVQDRHTAARRLELPRLGKVLLVAAALAAYTPASRDKRHFNDCFGNVFRVARPRHAPLLQSPLLATGRTARGSPAVSLSPRKSAGKSVSEKLEQDFLPRALPKTFTLLRWLALAECLGSAPAAKGRQASIGMMDAGTCQQIAALLRLGLVRIATGSGNDARGSGGYGALGVLKTAAQTWGSEWTQPLGWVLGQQQFLAVHARGKSDVFMLGAGTSGAAGGGYLPELFNSHARLALHAPLGVVKESADSLGINLAEALVG